jgi:hypothetical protein
MQQPVGSVAIGGKAAKLLRDIPQSSHCLEADNMIDAYANRLYYRTNSFQGGKFHESDAMGISVNYLGGRISMLNEYSNHRTAAK